MRTPMKVALTLAALGFAAAGCAEASEPGPGASAASRAAGAPVASCVTGNWRSTAVSQQASSGTTRANLSGGGGVAVTIGPNGETIIDFAKMQPVDFTTTIGGSAVSGKFFFTGQVSATVQTGAGSSASPTATPSNPTSSSPTASSSTSSSPTATPSTATPAPTVSTATPSTSASAAPAGSGTWQPVPPIDWGDTRVTVDLTEPMKARPVDNVKIANYVGNGADATGNVVDIEPLLGKGSYQCQGDSLILTPEDGGMAWTLTRA